MATAKNARLTQFEEIREVVIANVVKNVPELKKEKKSVNNKSLTEFG